jgi:hypothetical protein
MAAVSAAASRAELLAAAHLGWRTPARPTFRQRRLCRTACPCCRAQATKTFWILPPFTACRCCPPRPPATTAWRPASGLSESALLFCTARDVAGRAVCEAGFSVGPKGSRARCCSLCRCRVPGFWTNTTRTSQLAGAEAVPPELEVTVFYFDKVGRRAGARCAPWRAVCYAWRAAGRGSLCAVAGCGPWQPVWCAWRAARRGGLQAVCGRLIAVGALRCG